MGLGSGASGAGVHVWGAGTIAALFVPVLLSAQTMDHSKMKMTTPDSAEAVHEAMSGHMASSPHMRMTPERPRTAADSVRAIAIADTLRRALTKYADTSAATRDGYKMFLPKVKEQKIYHFTKWSNAFLEAFRFSVAKPTSLLYKRDSTSGKLKLIGAMYSMPKRASPADLDKRVPLSVTQWHLHQNLCVPRKGDESRFTETREGKPLFGLNGSIATKAACDAEHGNFRETVFGWMVHANVFEGTDLKTVWGHDDQAEHGERGKPR